jgi:hypothetical protein
MGFLSGIAKGIASVALTPVAAVVDIGEEILDVKKKSNSTSRMIDNIEDSIDEVVEEGIGEGKIV